MEISNLSDAEFKTLVIKILKELTGYFNGIKKTRADMKVKLSEIEKNLQGANSGVDEAENQINDLEHKEERKHSIRTTGRKKNPEKQGWAKEPLGQVQMYQHSNHRDAGRRRERLRN